MSGTAGLLVVVLAGGCGFRPITPESDLAGADLTAFDLAGADPTGADLSVSAGMGPGPLGALPAGYCCSASEQCRSRSCLAVGTGPYYCTDECRSNEVCNTWGGLFKCDVAKPSPICVPVNPTYTCLDPATYAYGSKPTGACCMDVIKGGQPCLGGLCISTGPIANPLFCSQGCKDPGDCPIDYQCFDRQCWKLDPDAPYTCNP